MKRLYISLLFILSSVVLFAQGWPANYGGVMLQGFSWDSYDYSQWTVLESQASDFKGYIDLIWVPQSGKALETSQVMGYLPYYYFNQNSSFGTEAELRSMIKTFKNNGIGTIADVVVNHHNTDGWFGFPAETYNGTTYQFLSTDIVSDDDGGATKTEATAEGVSLSSNADEGEGWSGARDLDHKSTNVQTIVKAYEKYLVNDLGYSGFRYDMVKGFAGSHVADYNDAAGVSYSVGEYWDGNYSTVEKWIDAASKKSAAFDFPFRYTVRDAINNNDWTKLGNSSIASDANYRQYSVTFVENHDTQYRSSTAQQDPIKTDTLAANAFLLAMPGTPCIFQPHWRAYKQELKAMIDARKLAGITNTSTYNAFSGNSATSYAINVAGSKTNLLAVVGSGANSRGINTANWVKILSGYHYAYYLAKAAETAWANVPSGEYDKAFDVTLTAVSATNGAKLVYTLDGTTPAASSTQVTSGNSINISSDCTLKVGLLINGVVSGIITRNYTISAFKPYDITVYLNTDNVSWSKVYFYTWNSAGTHNSSAWPGDVNTQTKTINGKTWYYKTYTMQSATDVVNFVFNNGSGTQTVDKTGVNKTSYFEIASTQTSGKYNINDVTETVTGINSIVTEKPVQKASGVYTVDGRKVKEQNSVEGLAKGLYIVNGKKVIVW
jgi:alpha-amylase